MSLDLQWVSRAFVEAPRPTPQLARAVLPCFTSVAYYALGGAKLVPEAESFFDKGFDSSEFVTILNRWADDVSLVAPLNALN